MDIVRRLEVSANRACVDTERASRRAFYGVSVAVFAISATVTIVGCGSMSEMGGMPMAGGWTMSMMWMRMPGQSWAGVAASFIGMWIVMMKAMMLPSLTPSLWCFRQSIVADAVARARSVNQVRKGDERRWAGRGQHAHLALQTRLGALVVVAGAAYFAVWLAYGAAIFVTGVLLAAVEIRTPGLARCVPVASGLIVLAAGTHQFTAWKVRHLGCCRNAPGCGVGLRADMATAWRHGVRLGVHCGACTLGLTAVLLVFGVMDLRTMGAVTVAMTAERLVPNGVRIARMIGVALVLIGIAMTIRAM